MLRTARHKTGEERGAQVVELAVALVLLLIIVAGVADMGRLFNSYIAISNAAREGARYYSRLPCTGATGGALRTSVLNAVKDEAARNGVTLNDGDITLDPNPVSACPAAGGAPITVSVTFGFDTLLVNFVPAATIDLYSATRMTWLGNDV